MITNEDGAGWARRQDGSPTPARLGWGARLAAQLPMRAALVAVATVWVLGCVWSFTEQTGFATAKGFSDAPLLPLIDDGLAAAMGGVAFAASLDGRPAVSARLGTALAVLASATLNGLWAAERSNGAAGPDWGTVAVGAGIPIAANIAFEVLLAELRRQVQRRRGLPAPTPLPTLRVARLLLSPGPAFAEWRREVLDRTAPHPTPSLPAGPATPGPQDPGPQGPGGLPDPTPDNDRSDSPIPVPSLVGPAEPVSAAAELVSVTSGAAGPAGGAESPTDAGGATDETEGPENTEGTEGAGDLAGPEPVVWGEERPEANAKVWRLAEYVRARGGEPAELSAEAVVELGLCESTRNARRLRDRAVALCAALEGPVPPQRPDLSGVPRLLLPGETPSLAIVSDKEN